MNQQPTKQALHSDESLQVYDTHMKLLSHFFSLSKQHDNEMLTIIDIVDGVRLKWLQSSQEAERLQVDNDRLMLEVEQLKPIASNDDALREENARLRAEVSCQKTTIRELEDKLKEAQAETANLKQSKQEMQQFLAELRAAAQILQDNIHKLEVREAQLVATNEKLQLENSRLSGKFHSDEEPARKMVVQTPRKTVQFSSPVVVQENSMVVPPAVADAQDTETSMSSVETTEAFHLLPKQPPSVSLQTPLRDLGKILTSDDQKAVFSQPGTPATARVLAHTTSVIKVEPVVATPRSKTTSSVFYHDTPKISSIKKRKITPAKCRTPSESTPLIRSASRKRAAIRHNSRVVSLDETLTNQSMLGPVTMSPSHVNISKLRLLRRPVHMGGVE
ncbi:hypothetical protein AAVH_36305 [Aphelenchoides avenae]|nr:hypothetical protein AAVH_36305 [Aphelenchus avenae]